MSLQPIDLQTLFVRLSQIGKEQAARKDSAVLEQEARGNQMAKQAMLNDETVSRTKEMQEESSKVKERKEGKEREKPEGQKDMGRGSQGKSDNEEKEENKRRNIFEDPALGKNIDLSG